MRRQVSNLIGSALLLAGPSTALCTKWDQKRTNIDDGGSFSNTFSQSVDQMLCPADASEECHFDTKVYDLTAERALRGPGWQPLDLSAEEEDAIFKLAEKGFNDELSSFSNSSNSSSGNGFTPREFITRDAQVSTATLDSNSIILEVKPGVNSTLLWTNYYMYSFGTLDGCTNETLNGMDVTAAAPYLTQDKEAGNATVLAGGWASTNSPTDDDSTGSASLNGRAAIGVVYGVSFAMAVLGFVL